MFSLDKVLPVIRSILITIVCTMTVYLMYNSAQDLERWFYPVVGKLTITRMESVGPGSTRVWVLFEKRRPCRPIEVYWYHGRRDGVFERVQFVVEKPLGNAHYVNRPIGMQKSGPWLISLPIEDMQTMAFSDAQHDCVPFWTTVSRFYN